MASERLAVAFCGFLRGFCKESRPLVLFIDDLQFAHSNSKNVLITLMQDREMENLLIIGGFRDGEDASILRSLTDRLVRPVTEICVGNLNLSLPCVNQLVADVLSMETEQARSLADVVHRKTLGNPYFCLQFLDLLQRQFLLIYSFATHQWEWDDQLRAETDISENVADVVTKRIESMPPEVRRVLKVAACVGYYVDIDLLETLNAIAISLEDGKAKTENMKGSSTETCREIYTMSFERALQIAEEEGFIETVESYLKFSHDNVQQIAYELILAGLPLFIFD
jgi:predicted ATPase